MTVLADLLPHTYRHYSEGRPGLSPSFTAFALCALAAGVFPYAAALYVHLQTGLGGMALANHPAVLATFLSPAVLACLIALFDFSVWYSASGE